MKDLKLSLSLASILILSVFAATADDKLDATKLPAASTKTGLTYATDIKPIFDKSCVKCHSGDKAKGKLHMDSLEGIIKGGKEAPNILPGKSDKSTLVYAIAHVGDDEDEFMPPLKNRAGIVALTKDQVGLIRAWIDQGAK